MLRVRAGGRSAPLYAGRGSSAARSAVGFATGALTTFTGVSGPPIALWLSKRGLTPGQVRDSLTAMFLAIGVIALLALLPVLGDARVRPALLATGLAGVIGGHALGSRAFGRLEARHFEPLLVVVVLGAAVASIAAGVAAF